MPRRVGVSIGTGPTIFPMWRKSYAMQLSAAAAAGITSACPRVAGRVTGNGCGAQLGDQVVVLCSLRSGKAQLLICALQITHLALRQEVKDSAAILVLVIDNVTRSGVDRVAGIASLRRHVVPHLGDSCPVFATAICGLHLHGVELLH